MSPFAPLPESVAETVESRGELSGRLWRRGENRSACLYVHGIESHSQWFRTPAGLLAAGGVDVWAFDRRGAGLSRGERPFVGSFETFWHDYRELALRLRREYERLHLVTLSWGGRLGVLLAGRDPDFFDSVSFLTPGFVPKVDYSLKDKARILHAATYAPDRLFDLPIEPEMFTDRPAELGYIRNDPLRTRQVPSRFLREMPSMDRLVRRLAPRVTSPAALYLAEREEIINVRAARKLFKRLGSRSKRERLFHAAKHALVFERPEELARELADHFSSAPRRKLSVLVTGVGGVGGFLAGKLARRGHQVTILARPAQAAAIEENGLVLREEAGEEAVRELSAAAGVPAGGNFDLAIFAVKSFDTSDAANAARPGVGQDTIVASFQNGLAGEEQLAEIFPGRKVLAAAICAYLSSPEPGVIRRTGTRGGVALASYRGVSDEELANLADLFRAAGLAAVTGAAASVKWSKLLLNVSFNAVSAASDLTVGEILRTPELFALGVRAFREALAAARAAGAVPVNLPGYGVRLFCKVMGLPVWLARRLALLAFRGPEREGRSSMWQDLSRGKGRTEIASLNGAVVRAAQGAGLPCPVNKYLVEVLEKLAARPAEWERYKADPLLLAREAPGAEPAASKEKPASAESVPEEKG